MTTGNIGPMPPYGVLDGFLPDEDRDALLAWTIENRDTFEPAKVFTGPGGNEHVDPSRRSALKHYGIGRLEPVIRQRLLASLPEIMAASGYNGPEPRSIEFELNAYGDGAHFAPHIDIPLGVGRQTSGDQPGEDRVISAVYYFFREPKSFSGGALRLYRFGADHRNCSPDDSVELEPTQNRLVVFPSWARHAVEPVRCEGNEFAGYRFALNCWFCRKLGRDAADG